ncbi:hypothetical protein [Candidatus Neptunichlamydia sp. REUL1]|uniref:hypothetical protein n=1 Tax=Candidatus Neptunichlamydia sp. REUL1 TaxID=3064277 RepID=UPI00292D4517|nr:hypothetical protein [Candidatus Neptunochlamydia sp. REUL1]
MRTGALLATPNATIPKLSSTAKAAIGAITNSIEKSLHGTPHAPSRPCLSSG